MNLSIHILILLKLILILDQLYQTTTTVKLKRLISPPHQLPKFQNMIENPILDQDDCKVQ